MTNIDPAIVEAALGKWFHGPECAPYVAPGHVSNPDGCWHCNEAAEITAPLIAAAVDAARAEGYEQGKAAVREAVTAVMLSRFPSGGEPVLSITMPVAALRAALEGTP